MTVRVTAEGLLQLSRLADEHSVYAQGVAANPPSAPSGWLSAVATIASHEVTAAGGVQLGSELLEFSSRVQSAALGYTETDDANAGALRAVAP